MSLFGTIKYSNSKWDRALNSVASVFRPRGDVPEQFFLTKGEQLGKKAADLNRAVQLSRLVDQDIDRIFPNIKSTFNKPTQAEKFQVYVAAQKICQIAHNEANIDIAAV